jgi:hypothetical protein
MPNVIFRKSYGFRYNSTKVIFVLCHSSRAIRLIIVSHKTAGPCSPAPPFCPFYKTV